MINAMHSRPREGQAELALTRLCCPQISGDGGDGPRTVFPAMYSQGVYCLASVVLDPSGVSRIAWGIRADERTLCFLFKAKSMQEIRSSFTEGVPRRIKQGLSALHVQRIPNRMVRTRDVEMELIDDGDKPDFDLAAAGVSQLENVIPQGPDMIALQLENITLHDTVAETLDNRARRIWMQFLHDLVAKSPVHRPASEGSYLQLSPGARQDVRDELFQRSNLEGVFDVVQFQRCTREKWDNDIFNRFFPPKGFALSPRTQNYAQCNYFKAWNLLMLDVNAQGAETIRAKFRQRVNKLTWLPYAYADRMWTTRTNASFEFRPTDCRNRVPAPQLAINPHTRVRELLVPSQAQTRIKQRARQYHAQVAAEREEEEESGSE